MDRRLLPSIQALVTLLLVTQLAACIFDESGSYRWMPPSDAGPVSLPPAGETLATYATGTQRFNDVLPLTDGTLLIVGSTTSLDWLPADVQRTELQIGDILGISQSLDIGFILQISADLQRILKVAYLRRGVVFDLRTIKTNGKPGYTEDLYISGTTTADKNLNLGMFIAKLDGNFLTTVPTGFAWVHNFWVDNWQRENHVWDVDGLGRVTFAAGADFDASWLAIYRLSTDGQLAGVEHWRNHWGDPKAFDLEFSPISSRPDLSVDYSAIVLKIPRCGLRSWTESEYLASGPDGNGGTRQGQWPFDAFAAGPCDPTKDDRHEGVGYTGYRMYDQASTHRAAGIVADRRNHNVYISVVARVYSPDNHEVKQSAVIALRPTGELRWWSRLHDEESGASVPEVLADRLRIDYSSDRLVVVAHSIGGGESPLWPGNQIPSRMNARGFHSLPTGNLIGLNLGWIGKLDLDDGHLVAASYVGTYGNSLSFDGAIYPSPAYNRWPDHDDMSMNHQLYDTAIDDLTVTEHGQVMIVARGLRAVTTEDALMQAVLDGPAPTSAFARIYMGNLETLQYSTLVRGRNGTSEEVANVLLRSVTSVEGSLIAVGYHLANGTTPQGQPMPTKNVPPWGASSPAGETGVLLRLP